jgi:hypothetical protein
MRQKRRRDLYIVSEHLALGKTGVRIIDFIYMRDGNLCPPDIECGGIGHGRI